MNKRRATYPWLAIALLLLVGLVVFLTARMSRTDTADFRLLVIAGISAVAALVLVGAVTLRRGRR